MEIVNEISCLPVLLSVYFASESLHGLGWELVCNVKCRMDFFFFFCELDKILAERMLVMDSALFFIN